MGVTARWQPLYPTIPPSPGPDENSVGSQPRSQEGGDGKGGPGVLVPALPRSLFPGLEEALSAHESQLVKITRLSIIPTATLLGDSVFQAQLALQGPEQQARRAWTFLAGLGQESVF